MSTPSVVRLPPKALFLWDNARIEVEARLAEAGDTRRLPDTELLYIVLDAALCFVSRGKGAEVHAGNSEILHWLRSEDDETLPAPSEAIGNTITELRERLDRLSTEYEAWIAKKRGVDVVVGTGGRILSEAEAADLPGEPILPGPDDGGDDV